MPQKSSWSKKQQLTTVLLGVYSLCKRLPEWSLHCLWLVITHRLESQVKLGTCCHCVLGGFEADIVGQFRCYAKGCPKRYAKGCPFLPFDIEFNKSTFSNQESELFSFVKHDRKRWKRSQLKSCRWWQLSVYVRCVLSVFAWVSFVVETDARQETEKSRSQRWSEETFRKHIFRKLIVVTTYLICAMCTCRATVSRLRKFGVRNNYQTLTSIEKFLSGK